MAGRAEAADCNKDGKTRDIITNKSLKDLNMKKNELKEKSIEELSNELDKAKKTLKEMQFKKVVSVVENPIQIRELKRQIARIKTYIHEKELQKIYSEIKGSEK